MGRYKIIETDNFGGDYPDEKEVNLPVMNKEHGQQLADAINSCFPENHSRYWRVVPADYELAGGFEP